MLLVVELGILNAAQNDKILPRSLWKLIFISSSQINMNVFLFIGIGKFFSEMYMTAHYSKPK